MGVIGFFIELGSTGTLTEMSTRNISWVGGKGGRCVGLTTLPPSCTEILGVSTSWVPRGLSRVVRGLIDYDWVRDIKVPMHLGLN